MTRRRIACAAHVSTYTATALVAVLALAWRTDVNLSADPLTAGLTISAVTHDFADRCAPLRRIAGATGGARSTASTQAA